MWGCLIQLNMHVYPGDLTPVRLCLGQTERVYQAALFIISETSAQ